MARLRNGAIAQIIPRTPPRSPISPSLIPTSNERTNTTKSPSSPSSIDWESRSNNDELSITPQQGSSAPRPPPPFTGDEPKPVTNQHIGTDSSRTKTNMGPDQSTNHTAPHQNLIFNPTTTIHLHPNPNSSTPPPDDPVDELMESPPRGRTDTRQRQSRERKSKRLADKEKRMALPKTLTSPRRRRSARLNPSLQTSPPERQSPSSPSVSSSENASEDEDRHDILQGRLGDMTARISRMEEAIRNITHEGDRRNQELGRVQGRVTAKLDRTVYEKVTANFRLLQGREMASMETRLTRKVDRVATDASETKDKQTAIRTSLNTEKWKLASLSHRVLQLEGIVGQHAGSIDELNRRGLDTRARTLGPFGNQFQTDASGNTRSLLEMVIQTKRKSEELHKWLTTLQGTLELEL